MRRSTTLGTHTYVVNSGRQYLTPTAYASQTGPRTFSSSSWNQGLHDVLPTTTRLTDAMTYRYNQVAALDSEQMLPQPDINTESSMARARVESDFCDCSCTCNKLTYNQTGGFDLSVFDTFVQLTEGRSARDQPKQPPAKKPNVMDGTP